MSSDQPLVSLFKEQLENECASLAGKHELSRGLSLQWWYFLRLEDLAESETQEADCDGGNDLGIDAIRIDDEDIVHFYSFKNPKDSDKAFPDGDVDKTLSGLRLILNREHESIANEELKERIREIYKAVPKAYRVHFVTSGASFGKESRCKLDAFVKSLNVPSESFLQWGVEGIRALQDRFYVKNLPAIQDPIVFETTLPPYMVRSGSSDCYLLHTSGHVLAELFGRHGNGLLQRNIRVDQGMTPVNRSIHATCGGEQSANFLHYNNGVTFLCETASHDPFRRLLTLHKAQVVNGGQTIRAIHRALSEGSLKKDTLVPIRVITSNGDKEFASSVAVNQNNQNQMRTGFLRSNDPRIVQLANSLTALGWYLERREGEVDSFTTDERTAVEHKIGRSLDGRVIRLKEGAQAYTATFYKHPELAKKDPKKIFLSDDEGGHFDSIFSSYLTAEKIVIAYRIRERVDDFVGRFVRIRRKKQREGDWKPDYEQLLGPSITGMGNEIDQIVPTSPLFLCAVIFRKHCEIEGKDPKELPSLLDQQGDEIIRQQLLTILQFASTRRDLASKNWPTLLKSNTFFNHIISYMQGVLAGRNGH